MNGVVFSQNVVHKRMRRHITAPRVLLVGCPIDSGRQTYETRGGRIVALRPKLSSIDTLLQQERKHFELIVDKIVALEPDVVLCEQRVARLAQELFLEKNITLITHVKPHVMERIAYTTNTQILLSVDAEQIASAQCGTAERFFVQVSLTVDVDLSQR